MNPHTGQISNEAIHYNTDGFVPVPTHLQDFAQKALGGNSTATIDIKGDTPLAQWAAKQRKKQRVRNRMAKRSRKQNR